MIREKQVTGLLQEPERKRPLRDFIKRSINRVNAESSKKNRRKGRIATVIGVGCATVLSLGIVTAPLGITLLAIGATLFSGKAINHARKTKEDLPESE